ncbi:MAG: tetratricopeptide repeat protein [Rhodospirillales bacterium]
MAQRKALEEPHPVLGVRLGSAKRNMGPIYPNTPRLADTEEAYVAELEALEGSLGPDHPDVAAALYRLARLYQRQSRYEPAGKMYERCLALREKILPAGHPDIIETLLSYARLLRASGFSDLAAAMRKRAEAEKTAPN